LSSGYLRVGTDLPVNKPQVEFFWICRHLLKFARVSFGSYPIYCWNGFLFLMIHLMWEGKLNSEQKKSRKIALAYVNVRHSGLKNFSWMRFKIFISTMKFIWTKLKVIFFWKESIKWTMKIKSNSMHSFENIPNIFYSDFLIYLQRLFYFLFLVLVFLHV